MPRFHSVAASTLLLTLVAVAVWPATGRLRGTVEGEQGEPLANVRITVTCEALPTYRETLTSDEDGEFLINFQRSQFVYILRFDHEGHRSLEAQFQPSGTRLIRETFTLEALDVTAPAPSPAPVTALEGPKNEAIVAYNEGLTAQKRGDLATARARFESAMAAQPELPQAQIALAGVMLDQELYEEALSAAERGAELKPGDVEALRVRYEALRALGRRDAADAALEDLKSAEDNVITAKRIYNEGADAYQQGDLDTAFTKFQEAARLDPGLHDAHHALASIHLAREAYAQAASAAEIAISLEPNDARTLRVAYDAYRELGDTARLQEIAARLAEVDPEFGGTELLDQGTALFNAGKVEEASSLLEEALSIDPSLSKAHFMLGLIAVRKDEQEVARRHLETFLEQSPQDEDAETAQQMLEYLDQG